MSTAAAATLAPGIFRNLSFPEYAQLPAVNHSSLEPFKRTPAHAREEMLHPKEGTAALQLGHAFHTFLLEPERFALEYTVPPKVNRRFKEGKATWAAWEAENPGKVCLKAEEYSDYQRMRDAILAHPTAGEMLKAPGYVETSLVWYEGETAAKGRLDIITRLAGDSWIVDLKTTQNADERAFHWDASKYGYFRAMAWYRRGLHAVKPGPPRRCAFICVEKDPPFCVSVLEADERALEQGEREMLAFLETYLRCEATGLYPGYPDGMGLIDYPPGKVDEVM